MFTLSPAYEEARVRARVRLTIAPKLAFERNIKCKKRGKSDYSNEKTTQE